MGGGSPASNGFTLSKMRISACFSPFNHAFRFHLMTSRWDQERVYLSLLAIYSSWVNSGWGNLKYLKHDEWKYCQVYGPTRKSKTKSIG